MGRAKLWQLVSHAANQREATLDAAGRTRDVNGSGWEITARHHGDSVAVIPCVGEPFARAVGNTALEGKPEN
jgi:hypothetical protein